MPPLRDIRRSRRLSRKSPVQVEDYEWRLQGIPSVPLFPSPAHVPVSLPSPSSSACTATDPDSPLITHLPFAPGSSHTRKRKQGHIPRPPNAFMVFRSWLWNKDNLKSIERDNPDRTPFRCMAEEAKARHAQLYPEYKYSPGSQKKSKIPAQRRSQRGADLENAKCKKVAGLSLGGPASRDLQKYIDDGEHKRVQVQVSFEDQDRSVLRMRDTERLRMEPLPRPEPKNAQTVHPLPFVPTTPAPYTVSQHMLRATEEKSEATPTPGPSEHTPELTYPRDVVEELEFVATNDIPYLSLDCYEDLMLKIKEDDFNSLYPSHLRPAAHSVFSGVKPQATSFVDSSYFTPDSGLVPLGSPVFTNPFESSSMAGHSMMLGTLDQLFAQPVSPLTLLPTESW
ncbi:hypothetical protein JVU11DRAFT_5466 [Chiua virens]|nr:hypothetical protein JVU11DRAFT_5466 [Chiua virens]